MQMINLKIHKGDMVEVLAGKDRGKRAKVLSVDPKNAKLVAEGLNILKKHTRPKRQGEKGQIVEFPASLSIAKVALVCPHCQKKIRVGYRVAAGKKERWCRKCQASL